MKDLEQSLARELREVGAGVRVPPLPALPTGDPRSTAGGLWVPLLAAAAVVLIIGVVALVLGQPASRTPQPAGPNIPAPSLDGTQEPAPVRPDAAPTTQVQDSYTAEQALDSVIQAVVADDRAALVAPGVIADEQWTQLVTFAAGEGGSGSTCRDNGGGTRDCEIIFDAERSTVYYAILEPAQNSYGWRVTYVSIAEA